MKCLIIAAGQGTRIAHQVAPKPLVPVLGVPLVERVVRAAVEAGADDFVVVTGFLAERLGVFLHDLSRRLQVPIQPVVNQAWEQGNGISVLKGESLLQEEFALLMADHLFDPQILWRLRQEACSRGDEGQVWLAVDQGLATNRWVDLEDVTRVMVQEGRIAAIGKQLHPYNGYDTGIFWCSPVLFSALETASTSCGDTSLSGGMRVLAARGRARALDSGGRFWIDVDDRRALLLAEAEVRLRQAQSPQQGA